MYLIQPVRDMWNVVITEVRHEEQIFASTSMQRLDAHNKDVRDVKLLIVSFRNNRWDS
jgi:hypothetical protein